MRRSFRSQANPSVRETPAPRRFARPLLALLLVGLSWALLPAPVRAAEPAGGLTTDWTAAEIDHFRFFVQTPDQTVADAVAVAHGAAAEAAFAELSLLFAIPPPPERIPVYVYTDPAAYDAGVAAAARRELEGVTGIADPAAGDVTLFLPTLQNQSPLEAENALRHAVSHVLLARVSGGKLPWGFDEGIAQYVERPVNERLARTAAMVQAANQRGELASWFDMNRTNASVEPVLAGAQSYAVVAFLVERYEIGPLRQFLRELPAAPSWREALRLAYGRDPNAIEKQWKEDLPRWTSGGWRTNLVAAFDLEPAKQLLAQANYAAAKEVLEPSQTLFRQLNEPEQLAAVEALIAQCDIGIQAESLMTQTQQALELHTYDRAANLLAQAKLQFEQLPEEQRPLELIGTYETLAGDGARAAGQLDQAIQLSHSWRDYPDAREAALDAGTTFARLGDEEGMNRADQELADLDQRQRQIVLLLGALAVLTLAWLALWLWARGPSELDWR